MSSRRYPNISLNTNSQAEDINISEWLKEAKLSDHLSTFVRESITIDELIGFNESELQTIAEETLKLNTLHTNRFIKAMNATKRRFNHHTEVYNGSSTSSSSSAASSSSLTSPMISIHRPASPALSVQSMDRNKYHNSNNNHHQQQISASATQSPWQSPKVSTKYNGHYHNHHHRRRSSHPPRSVSTQIFSSSSSKAKQSNNSLPPKPQSQRFSKHKKRNKSETDFTNTNGHMPIADLTQLFAQKSAPNSPHHSSSNSTNSSENKSKTLKQTRKSNKKRRNKKKKTRKKRVKFNESSFSLPDNIEYGKNGRSKTYDKSQKKLKKRDRFE